MHIKTDQVTDFNCLHIRDIIISNHVLNEYYSKRLIYIFKIEKCVHLMYVCTNFRENFVQVDIFYQELSYEQLQENIAFDFPSLLSEIGGFLALLLGASALTVCEILDFVLIFLLEKFHVRKRIAAMISRPVDEG